MSSRHCPPPKHALTHQLRNVLVGKARRATQPCSHKYWRRSVVRSWRRCRAVWRSYGRRRHCSRRRRKGSCSTCGLGTGDVGIGGDVEREICLMTFPPTIFGRSFSLRKCVQFDVTAKPRPLSLSHHSPLAVAAACLRKLIATEEASESAYTCLARGSPLTSISAHQGLIPRTILVLL